VGVEQGIILAIVLSLIDHTRRGYRPKNAVMVPSKSGLLHAQPVATRAEAVPGLLIYRFTHSMYYANAEQLSEQITALVNNAEPPLRWFCLDASAVDDVDYSAAETLRSIFATLKDKGIRLVVAQVLDDVKAESRYNLRQLFGEDAFYDTLEDVVEAYQQQTGAAAS
jgi:MFS superfamily sulfate permease-like transporter